MSNLETYFHFKLISKKCTSLQVASGYPTAPHDTRTISYKAWNPFVEYPSMECKHDIKESKGNMFNPRFKENVQGGNIQEDVHLQNQNYFVTEPIRVVQSEKNGHKKPNNGHNYHDENHDEI